MSRESTAQMAGVGFIIVCVVHALLSLFIIFIIFVYGAKSSITPDTAREFLPVL